MANKNQSLLSLNVSYKPKHNTTTNHSLPQPPASQPRQSDLPPRYTETPVMPAYPQPMYFVPPLQLGGQQQQQQQQQGGQWGQQQQQQQGGQLWGQQQQQQQQQSTNVVVIGGQQPPPAIVQVRRSSISFTGAFVFSCAVIWLFGSPCGLIAFIVALIGKYSADKGDDSEARRMLLSSYGLSAAGVVTGVILIIVLLTVPLNVNIPSDINSNRHNDISSNDNKNVCPTTSCYYGYRYDSFHCKVCCSSWYDSSDSKPDCGPPGFYYSNGKKYCCPYKD